MAQSKEAKKNHTDGNEAINHSIASSIQFKLESFEGPLDLLLHLIKKEKIDIYDIPIAQITAQYMKIVTSSVLQDLDLDIAGEYLLMAATLAQIKSKMLLPDESATSDNDSDEYGKDPRSELVKKLLEYQRFKDASEILASAPKYEEDIYKSGYHIVDINVDETEGVSSDNIDIYTLLSLFDQMISKLPEETPHEVIEEGITVSRKIVEIINYMSSTINDQFRFNELFSVKTRPEAIVSFLSILELSRLKYITLHQPDQDGEIWVTKKFMPGDIDFTTIYSIEQSYSKQQIDTEEQQSEAKPNE